MRLVLTDRIRSSRVRVLAVVACGLIGAAQTPDTWAADFGLRSEEIQLISDYFKEFILTSKRPMTVYHWTQSVDAKTYKSSSDPRGFEYIRKASSQYWRSKSVEPQVFANYGLGLYTASDPVVSRAYGGFIDGSQWLLVEIKIPAGFKTLDITTEDKRELPVNVRTALRSLSCDQDLKRMTWTHLFRDDYRPNSICANYLDLIFHQLLGLHGLAYEYRRAEFKVCPNSSYQEGRAFILTSNEWLTPEHVRIYSTSTNDDEAGRLRIQSMFSENLHSSIADLWELKQGTVVMGLKRKPQKHQGIIGKNRFERALHFLKTSEHYFDPWVLWPEFQGKKIDKDINSWIKMNLYGCQDNKPFLARPELEAIVQSECDQQSVDSLSMKQIEALMNSVYPVIEGQNEP